MSAMKPIHVQEYDRRADQPFYRDPNKAAVVASFYTGTLFVGMIIGMAIMRGWMAL